MSVSTLFTTFVATFCTVIQTLTSQMQTNIEVASGCYGSALHLYCPAKHRIHITAEFFGLGKQDLCHYSLSDCTIINPKENSLPRRLCEGQGRCTVLLGDRQLCGAAYTNYQQVEYDCVPDELISDMCKWHETSLRNGYISTPNYPDKYPGNVLCTCSLWSSDYAKIKLESRHFLITFDQPCRDYIEIDDGRRLRRLCGSYYESLVSDIFRVVFHTDYYKSHVGAWFYFTSYPENLGGKVHLKCHNVADSTTSAEFSTQATSAETSVKATLSPGNYQNPSSLAPPRHLVTTTVRPNQNKAQDSTHNLSYPSWDDIQANDVEHSKPGDIDFPLQRAKSNSSESDAAGSAKTRERDELANTQDTETVEESGIKGLNKHMKGIIIISTCAGGIVVVGLLLALIPCYAKRRQNRQAQRSPSSIGNQYLRHHTHNLDYYDSVQIEERRAAASLRASPLRPGPLTRYNFKLNRRENGNESIPKNGDTGARRVLRRTVQEEEGPVWTTVHAEVICDEEGNSSAYSAQTSVCESSLVDDSSEAMNLKLSSQAQAFSMKEQAAPHENHTFSPVELQIDVPPIEGDLKDEETCERLANELKESHMTSHDSQSDSALASSPNTGQEDLDRGDTLRNEETNEEGLKLTRSGQNEACTHV